VTVTPKHDAMIVAIEDCYANFQVDMTELEKRDPDSALRIWCAMAANRVPEEQAREIRLRAERQAKRLWRTARGGRLAESHHADNARK
jgi:hypothetical protein